MALPANGDDFVAGDGRRVADLDRSVGRRGGRAARSASRHACCGRRTSAVGGKRASSRQQAAGGRPDKTWVFAACRRCLLPAACSSFLHDRQIVVRNLQDDARHRRGVVAAEQSVSIQAPSAAEPAADEQVVADRRKPVGPPPAAGRPHHLGGVVMAVEIVLARRPAAGIRRVGPELRAGTADRGRSPCPGRCRPSTARRPPPPTAGIATARPGGNSGTRRRCSGNARTYSTHLSTVLLGTSTPAFRAARRAMIWQTVTEMSAVSFRG